MSKYKYYFRKPKSKIAEDIFNYLLLSGAICIAATSPYFALNLIKGLKKFRKYGRGKIRDTFYNLRRQGYIEIKEKNHQIYIKLTKEGKKKASWMQIDSLKIKKPKKWDKKWRIVIFDIAQLKKLYREVFRGKLKEMGFYPLQKSVWVHPFDCYDEIELLKNFLGLSDKEIRLITAEKIDKDSSLRKIFKF